MRWSQSGCWLGLYSGRSSGGQSGPCLAFLAAATIRSRTSSGPFICSTETTVLVKSRGEKERKEDSGNDERTTFDFAGESSFNQPFPPSLTAIAISRTTPAESRNSSRHADRRRDKHFGRSIELSRWFFVLPLLSR